MNLAYKVSNNLQLQKIAPEHTRVLQQVSEQLAGPFRQVVFRMYRYKHK